MKNACAQSDSLNNDKRYQRWQNSGTWVREGELRKKDVRLDGHLGSMYICKMRRYWKGKRSHSFTNEWWTLTIIWSINAAFKMVSKIIPFEVIIPFFIDHALVDTSYIFGFCIIWKEFQFINLEVNMWINLFNNIITEIMLCL